MYGLYMGTVEIKDPEEHRTNRKVDQNGRVFIGSDHAGKTVNVVVEVIDE